MTRPRPLHGEVALGERGFSGHVFDPEDLQQRFVVELLIDGLPVALTRADAFAPELSHVGDGDYGFGFGLPDSLLDDEVSLAEVRIANTGEVVGEAIRLSSPNRGTLAEGGRVAWSGGLRLSGWFTTASAATPVVRAVVEGRVVASAAASSWTYTHRGTILTAVPAFDIWLPEALADGRVHRVEVLDDGGRALSGSPCHVLAIPDALRDGLVDRAGTSGERFRLAASDRMMPRSAPFSEWSTWRERFPDDAVAESAPLRATIVLVGGEPDDTLSSLAQQRGVDWTAVHLPTLGGAGSFDPQALAAHLEEEAGDAVVIFALGGIRFHPGALRRFDEALATSVESVLAYADAEIQDGGQRWPLLWPAYDAERQLEQGYGALAFAARSGSVRACVRQGADSLPAVFLDLVEQHGARPATALHIPQVLAELPPLDPTALCRTLARAARRQLARHGVRARVVERHGPGLPAIRVLRETGPERVTVAVIAPQGLAPGHEALGLLRDRLGGGAREFIVASHRPLRVGGGWRALTLPIPPQERSRKRRPGRGRPFSRHRHEPGLFGRRERDARSPAVAQRGRRRQSRTRP